MIPTNTITAATNLRRLSRPIWYMASPYNHDDPDVRQARFEAVCQVAASYLKQGLSLFSPIAHSHPIEVEGFINGGIAAPDASFWRDWDLPLMEACCGIITVTLPGWKDSVGVAGEEEFFRLSGLPVVRDASWPLIIKESLYMRLMGWTPESEEEAEKRRERLSALAYVKDNPPPEVVIALPDLSKMEDEGIPTGKYTGEYEKAEWAEAKVGDGPFFGEPEDEEEGMATHEASDMSPEDFEDVAREKVGLSKNQPSF